MHDKDALSRRLKKIIGQLNGIDKMIEQDTSCTEILVQINAAKSALHKVGQIVLEGHITHCVRDSLCPDSPSADTHKSQEIDKTLCELAKAIEHFSRLG